MEPEVLIHTPLGKPRQLLQRGGAGTSGNALRLGRIGAGHPEGYFEAFANVYRDAASAIRDWQHGKPSALSDPVFATMAEGVEGMRFINACQVSSAANAKWVAL